MSTATGRKHRRQQAQQSVLRYRIIPPVAHPNTVAPLYVRCNGCQVAISILRLRAAAGALISSICSDEIEAPTTVVELQAPCGLRAATQPPVEDQEHVSSADGASGHQDDCRQRLFERASIEWHAPFRILCTCTRDVAAEARDPHQTTNGSRASGRGASVGLRGDGARVHAYLFRLRRCAWN